MRHLLRIFVISAFCLTEALSQGGNLWEDRNGVTGFIQLERGANDRLFGIRGDGVIYSSSDRGRSWQTATVLGGEIVVLLARGNYVVAARHDLRVTNFFQVHRSTDNGESWTRISTANRDDRNLFAVSDSGGIYGLWRDNIFGAPFGPLYLIRYDGGSGWPIVGTPLPNLAGSNNTGVAVTLVDHEDNFLLGNTRYGLFVTRDHAATWEWTFQGRGITALSQGAGGEVYLAADPNVTDGGVYVSSDGGRNWSYLGLPDRRVSALSADSSGNLLAATIDGIYHYTGTLDRWEYASPLSERFDVMMAVGGDTILALSGAWGLFRSADGGSSWFQSGPRKRDVFSIVVTSGGTLIAGTLGARVFTSSDDGSNWAQAPIGAICDNVYALAERGGVIFAETECGLYRSQDEGQTWTREGAESLHATVAALAIGPDGGVYAGSEFGIMRSGDGGASWLPSGLTSVPVVALAADPSGRICAVTEREGVFASTNSGATWSPLGLLRDDLQSIHVNERGTLFVGAYGEVLRMAAGGGDWEEAWLTEGYVSAVASLGSQSVYAATSEGVFVSNDDGRSWNAINSTGLFHLHALSLAVDQRGMLYAGMYNGGVYGTTRTMTGVGAAGSPPAGFSLLSNYPNPFNAVTTFVYSLDRAAYVRLRVVDLLGREVGLVEDAFRGPGSHSVRWDASEASSGVYFYHMTAGEIRKTGKLLLMR